MSGGFFDYKDMCLKDEIFDYEDRFKNVFDDIEISELVWDVLTLLHDYDWYKSGDTDEDNFLESKKLFKEKWLRSSVDVRIKRTIDEALNRTKDELYKTYNINE